MSLGERQQPLQAGPPGSSGVLCDQRGKGAAPASWEALLAAGTEKTAFAELSVREVVDDPLTVEKLEELLASVRAMT